MYFVTKFRKTSLVFLDTVTYFVSSFLFSCFGLKHGKFEPALIKYNDGYFKLCYGKHSINFSASISILNLVPSLLKFVIIINAAMLLESAK